MAGTSQADQHGTQEVSDLLLMDVKQPYQPDFDDEDDEEERDFYDVMYELLLQFIRANVPVAMQELIIDEVDQVDDNDFFPCNQVGGISYAFNVFSWGSTPQGGDFWNTLQEAFSNDPSFPGNKDDALKVLNARYNITATPQVALYFDDPAVMGRN